MRRGRNDAGSGQGFCPVAGGSRGRSHAPDKGGLRVGENILLIVIGAGHQKEVFDVCEYILERIKESVLIWKKEIGEGGEHWVAGRVARKRRVIQRRGSPAS